MAHDVSALGYLGEIMFGKIIYFCCLSLDAKNDIFNSDPVSQVKLSLCKRCVYFKKFGLPICCPVILTKGGQLWLGLWKAE